MFIVAMGPIITFPAAAEGAGNRMHVAQTDEIGRLVRPARLRFVAYRDFERCEGIKDRFHGRFPLDAGLNRVNGSGSSGNRRTYLVLFRLPPRNGTRDNMILF